MTAHRSQAVVALLTTMLFWGTSVVFMRTTALTLTAENALALRYVLLVPMVVPGLLITGGWCIAREHWPRLILTAIGMFGSPGQRSRSSFSSRLISVCNSASVGRCSL